MCMFYHILTRGLQIPSWIVFSLSKSEQKSSRAVESKRGMFGQQRDLRMTRGLFPVQIHRFFVTPIKENNWNHLSTLVTLTFYIPISTTYCFVTPNSRRTKGTRYLCQFLIWKEFLLRIFRWFCHQKKRGTRFTPKWGISTDQWYSPMRLVISSVPSLETNQTSWTELVSS